MAVRDVLLDTNAYVAFKQGTPEAVEVFTHVPRIGINSIVLGELLSGFAIGTRAEANRQELQQFLTLAAGAPAGHRRGDSGAVCDRVPGTQTPWPSHADQ